MNRLCLLSAAICLLLPWASQAATVPLSNPGFENVAGETQVNEFTFGPLNGWALYDPLSITGGGAGPSFYIGTLITGTSSQFFPGGAPQGSRVGIAFNYGASATGEYGLTQLISGEFLAPNTQYVLSVQVGNIASGTSANNTFFNLSGFPGYRIDLMAGGTVLASDNNTLSIGDGAWAPSTVTYTTGSVTPLQQLQIRLVNLNAIDPLFPTADREVDFDAVSLTATAIPEPSAAFLLLFALLGAALTGHLRDVTRQPPPRARARVRRSQRAPSRS